MEETPPLTPQEIAELRQLILDAEHATWLRKQIFVVVPVVFAIVSAVAAAINWLWSHVTVKP